MWSDAFPVGLVPQILKLISDTWTSDAKPAVTDYEVPMTQALMVAMRRSKNAQRLPFQIWSESLEFHERTGQLLGRLDIRFSAGHREEVYFAIECKRLRYPTSKGTRPNTSEYVGRDGMMCFVSGQYSSSVEIGGMLGYVMDGNTTTAVTDVGKSIGRSKTKLCIAGVHAWKVSSLAPKATPVKESKHKLPNRTFTMYHVFLAV